MLLIWLPEMMNLASANALLKILEEPPAKTLFLLVCQSTDKLLTTLLSRTQGIRIRDFTDAGEFRSNLHRGGAGLAIRLSPTEREAALAAAKALGLGVAGVDMLQSNRGPLIMEVNSSPGLQGIESSTGIDIASRIIRCIETNISANKKDKIGV